MANTQVPSELIATNAISGTIIADNAITSVHIGQNQVTAVQIPDGSITATQIAADAVGATELAASSVVTASIQDDQVTGDKLANNITIAGTLGVTGALTANAGVAIDNITIDGQEIDLSSGELTIDCADTINLDADGAIVIKQAGTEMGRISNSSNNLRIQAAVSDADLHLRGNDGGSIIDAVVFDMSDAGTATFNHDVKLPDSGEIVLGAGSDLKLYHDASNSYIANEFGVLYIDQRVQDGNMIFRNDDGSGGNAEYIVLDGGGHKVKLKKATEVESSLEVEKAGDGNSPILHVIDTADTETAWFEGRRAGDTGAFIAVRHNPSTPQETNRSGIRFQADDDAGNVTNYARITQYISDHTDGTEDGYLGFNLMKGGSDTEIMRLSSNKLLLGQGNFADPTLEIDSATAGDPTINFNGVANRDAVIRFKENGTQVGQITYVCNGDYIKFSAGSNNNSSKFIVYGTGHATLEDRLGLTGVNASSDIAINMGTGTAGDVWRIGSHVSNTTSYWINDDNDGVYMTYGGTSWQVHSDERIKENITSLGTVLPDLVNMRCVKYNKKGKSDTKIGFIAQDWQSKFPEVVDEDDGFMVESDGSIVAKADTESTDKVKSVAYTETIPVLLKAIQELKAENDSLKSRVTALESS